MPISFRTPLSVTAASGAGFTMPTPVGTAVGDLHVAVVTNAGTTGPAAPTGWTAIYQVSAGSGQCCSVYTAPYSAGLTRSFTNAASAAVAVCGSYYEAGKVTSLDGTPVATVNTTNNTTLPTGAPTTGLVVGDFEVLAYSHTAAPTITTTAAGSTIDLRAVNGTACTAILGHNNTTSLGASTATTAFSHTLSAANTRKTGVGILLKAAARATSQIGGVGLLSDFVPVHQRQAGNVGVTVDVAPPEQKIRQAGSLGVNVDLVVPLGVQYGQAAVNVDMVPLATRRLGTLGIMLDYVPGIATAGIGWDGTQFVASGATPVLWGADAFQSSGGYPSVTWEDDHFEAEP